MNGKSKRRAKEIRKEAKSSGQSIAHVLAQGSRRMTDVLTG